MIELHFDYDVRFRTAHYRKDDSARSEMVLKQNLRYDRPLAEGETIDIWFHNGLPRHYTIQQIAHQIRNVGGDEIGRVDPPVVFADAIAYPREKAEDLREFDPKDA